jgi:3-phosphoshikimate 1-carboxyvinyltransferase
MSVKKFTVSLNHKIKKFNKSIEVDSDKSLSIRSFLIGSISQNISIATNVLESDDVKSCISACQKLGVKIIKIKSKSYKIFGKGLGSFFAKKNLSLDLGNSGTLARLLIGILSSTPNIEVNIKGDNSLNKRSMKKLFKLMSRFGAYFYPKNKYKFPIKMISSELPIGINYEAGISAQLKSAVMLAALNSYGNTEIKEKDKSRDHTENLLRSNVHAIKVTNEKIKIIKIFGKKYLKPFQLNIPGDPSSAAFFTALTLLNANSSIKIKNVGLNPTRTGFYQLLKKQGAKINFINKIKKNNELRGDIIVKSSKLKPIIASKSFYTSSTDEYPILFTIAALTKGVSVFKGINDLANKESDRIKEMQKILLQIGVESIYSKNELKIFGTGNFNASKKKITVPNLGDHRICMSSFILSILTGAQTKIKNFETVYTSSPSFLKIIKFLGAKFEIQK